MTTDDLTGRTLDGRYTLQARLGAGGMGAVYLAEQVSMARPVAVKVIAQHLITDARVTGRFLREARLCGRIAHPRVVSVFDFGKTEDGVHYLVMERLAGRTLADALAEGPLPPARAIDIAVQICDALEAAHRLDIVHRDLKPGNVMLLDTPDGRDDVKVLDFGLARSLDGDDGTLTQSGTMFGTPTYMSPEVAKGQGCDTRGDLYALGTILYELLAGAPPFTGTNALALAMHHAFQAPPTLPADVSPALAGLITALLEKEPDARPPDVQAVRARLLATPEAAGAAPSARPATPPAARGATLSGKLIVLIFLVFSGALGVSIRWMLAENPAILEPTAAPPAPDAGPRDAQVADAAHPDAARPDAARPDAARPDAAPVDAGLPDAAPADARAPDAALVDAARPDAAIAGPPRFLALGDSYTIGASVAPEERWPAQLVVRLRAGGQAIADPRYIAQSGWTTFALSAALDREAPVGPFGLVTLLIGVNDQFFHEQPEAYRLRFRALLDLAIGLAGGDACRVVVLSIPDYSVTPFGQGIDPVRIAREIAAFNDVNRQETADRGVRYVDVTPSSQQAADDPGLIAPDGLHPSGRMYAAWTLLAEPAAAAALACP